MPANDEWKWADEQGVQRVVRTDELRAAILSGRVPPSIRVWREGMKEWLPASAIPELARGLLLPMPGSRATGERPLPPIPQAKPRTTPPPQPSPQPPPLAPRVQTLVGVTPEGEELSAMPVPKLPSGRKATLKGPGDAKTAGSARPPKPPAPPQERTPTPQPAGKAGRTAKPPLPPAARKASSPAPPPAAVGPAAANDDEDDTLTFNKEAVRPALAKEEVTATARLAMPPPARAPLPSEPTLPLHELPPSPQALAEQLKPPQAVHDEKVIVAAGASHATAPTPEITRTLVLENVAGGAPAAASPAPSTASAAPQAERTQTSPLQEHAAPAAQVATQRSVPIDDSPTAPLPEGFDAAAEPPARVSSPADIRQPVAVPMSSLLGAGGAVVCMVVASFFAGRCSASGDAMLHAHARVRAAYAMAAAAIPPPAKPCWVSKQPIRWAAQASKSIPFELLATSSGTLAMGYASDGDRAVGIEVVPSTGKVIEKFSQNATGIERVTPAESGESFTVVTASGSGALKSAINVPAKTPFAIGLAGGALSVADGSTGVPSALWPIEGDRPLDAARVLVAEGAGYAVTFRRDEAIWIGWIGPDRKPSGALTKVVGSSGAVGKPMVGWNRRELAIVFADRPNGDASWQIRAGRAPTGSVPQSTVVIDLPPGGPGGDAFAPDITGLADGRWLMLWTEGPAGAKAVRAQTLAPDFAPVGDPIALSPPAGSFGQGVLGVSGSYVAAVFLSKGRESFELWGSILQCG